MSENNYTKLRKSGNKIKKVVIVAVWDTQGNIEDVSFMKGVNGMRLHNYYLVREESNYNKMIDFMFSDSCCCTFTESTPTSLLSFCLKNKVQFLLGKWVNPFLIKKFGLFSFFDSIHQDNLKKFVVFLNSSFIYTKYPASVMRYYKKKWPDLVFVLLYIDMVNHPVSQHANQLREEGLFDLVYTVDKADADKYKMIFTRTPYSVIDEYMNINPYIDVYFCGVTKDRGAQILSIYDCAQKKNISISMDILCKDEERNEFNKRNTINILNDYVSYDGLLNKTLHAKCILDLVQGGQSALTLRPYEAVVYDRKLLTNNKSIIDFEFYNPKYMQYFEKVEDIDWDWVKSEEKVNYCYGGEFSPKYLLERIIHDAEQ